MTLFSQQKFKIMSCNGWFISANETLELCYLSYNYRQILMEAKTNLIAKSIRATFFEILLSMFFYLKAFLKK